MSKEDFKKVSDGGWCDYCFCIDKKKEKIAFDSSENRLKHWKKWMSRRNQIQDKIARPLGRPVGELVMNMGDEFRNIQEDREMFCYTNIQTNFDKYRGNPEFWQLPPGLPDKWDNTSRHPVLFTVKTKVDRNEIPAIEYVRNANYILNEKNVLSQTRKIYNLWSNSKYRNGQMKTLSSKLNLIEPHKPRCEELIILGEKICAAGEVEEEKEEEESKTKASIPDFEFESLRRMTFPTRQSYFEVHSIPRLCCVINGTILSCDDILVNNTVKIRLLFKCTPNIKVPAVEYLKFENIGLSTLRFYWHRIEKFRIFRNLTERDRDECQEFYFNKNEILLVPGKTLLFPIWFKAKDVGNYTQFWKITTLPKIWDNDFQVIVLMQGIVNIVGFEEKANDIREMLEVRSRNTSIKDLLRSMLDNLKYTDTDTTSFIFTEKKLFESSNQEIWWGIEKRSKYLYDKEIVNELKKFYQQVKPPDFPSKWNYSVKELKIMTRKKDILDYVEKEGKEAVKARKRRDELKETPIVEPPPTKKTAGAKEKIVVQVVEPLQEEDRFLIKEKRSSKLEDLLHKLERPLMIENSKREEYCAVYIIMRTYLFKMCDALEHYDKYTDYSIMDEDYCPTSECDKERLIFERFDDIWLDGTKLVLPDRKIEYPEFPKPEILKDIPQEDTRATYYKYFDIPEPVLTAEKKGAKDKKKGKEVKEKDKKAKGKGDDKKKETDQKAKEKEKQEELRIITVKENFDPYAEEFVPPGSSLELAPCKSLLSPSKMASPSNKKLLRSVSSKKVIPLNPVASCLLPTPVKAPLQANPRKASVLSNSRKVLSNKPDLLPHRDYVKITEYNYDRYLIVYTHLTEAINAMVDTLETFKENIVPFETLGELTKCATLHLAEEKSSDTILEEVSDIKELQPEDSHVNEKSLEEAQYIRYLLDRHLNKNINTQKYLIHGLTLGPDDAEMSIVSEESEKVDSRVNVFRSHETLVESIYPSGSVSVGIQTSDVGTDYKRISSTVLLLDQSVYSGSVNTENTVGESLSHDMFYFMDECQEEKAVEAEEEPESHETDK